MSSLRDHFERVRATRTTMKDTARAAAVTARDTQTQTDFEGVSAEAVNLELKFFNDQEQLNAISSRIARNEKKAALLKSYIPYIEGVLAAGVSPQNDLLLVLMVWLLDTQGLALATDIAQFALLNDMVMPEPFSRDVACVFAEQFSEEVIKNAATPSPETAKRALDLVSDYDMPDEVRAKLYRAYGLSVLDVDKQAAISAYETALKLDASVGVKNELARLKKSMGAAFVDEVDAQAQNEAGADTDTPA
ncbi:MAG: phage terminase small subunit [Moraxella sp.]|nr:phage terminase small subunit [Moraxella sp.]